VRTCRELSLDTRGNRWWWYLGVPVAIVAGALLAVWLRTTKDDALTLNRGTRVDTEFLTHLDPANSPNAATPDGRFLVVVFGYTSCPDVCPTTLLAVHRALQQLGDGAGRVVPIFVTVDPERDGPDHLREYARSFDSRIRTLSDRAVLAPTLRTFRARAERHNSPSGAGYTMDHTAVLYLIDPERKIIAALPETSPSLDRDLVRSLHDNPEFSRETPGN
jgi:cytochrome oxidase Cu insertion factor (SCO1/SenC/PrrC family)